MYERILNRLRNLILERQYVVTLHAVDEMAADDFAVWDIESALLNGTIVEQQWDRECGERKYRVCGKALDERRMEVVVKLGPTGKLVVITVYAR